MVGTSNQYLKWPLTNGWLNEVEGIPWKPKAIIQLEADVFSCTTALGVLTERGDMVQLGLGRVHRWWLDGLMGASKGIDEEPNNDTLLVLTSTTLQPKPTIMAQSCWPVDIHSNTREPIPALLSVAIRWICLARSQRIPEKHWQHQGSPVFLGWGGRLTIFDNYFLREAAQEWCWTLRNWF